jgi:Methyltransferase FkbM domain
VRRIKVKVRRLDTILAEHAPDVSRLDLVSVDVEGWELEVLDGLSFERYRPKVLIVENLFAEAGYRQALAERGYALCGGCGQTTSTSDADDASEAGESADAARRISDDAARAGVGRGTDRVGAAARGPCVSRHIGSITDGPMPRRSRSPATER